MLSSKLPALFVVLALCLGGAASAKPGKPKNKPHPPKKFTQLNGVITNVASCTVNADGTVDATLTVQLQKSSTTQTLTLDNARVAADENCPATVDGCDLLNLAQKFGVHVHAKIDNATGNVLQLNVGDEVELKNAVLKAVDCTAGAENFTVTANGADFKISLVGLTNAAQLCATLDALPDGTPVEVEFDLCSVPLDANGNVALDQNGAIHVQALKVKLGDDDDEDERD